MQELRNFLHTYCPGKGVGRYVYVDQGGELYQSPKVRKLFKHHGFEVLPTGADSSHQNGPVERQHRTVADGMRAMLLGANLDVKFWPYAFKHYVRIRNSLPSRDQDKSPTEIALGRKDNFKGWRTIGTRVWVRPPGRRSAKLLSNSREGIFLGFVENPSKNIYWYDVSSNKVKIASRFGFDDGMNDLPTAEIPPNVAHLQRV